MLHPKHAHFCLNFTSFAFAAPFMTKPPQLSRIVHPVFAVNYAVAVTGLYALNNPCTHLFYVALAGS